MNTTKAILLCAAVAAGAAGCRKPAEGAAGSEPDAAGVAGLAAAVPFAHERRAALSTDEWGGMRVDWTAVADWPIGDSPAAKAARAWIEEQFRYRGGPFDGDPEDRIRLPRCGDPFEGDSADWDAMTRFHGGCFLAENGPKQMEAWWHKTTDLMEGFGMETPAMPQRSPGRDVFLEGERQEQPYRYSRHSAIVEYEDDYIVSYRAGLCDFQVGNSLGPSLYVRGATFRKADGKMLDSDGKWDDFDGSPPYGLVVIEGEEKTGPLVTRDGIGYYLKYNGWRQWADAYDDEVAFSFEFHPWKHPAPGDSQFSIQKIENGLPHEMKVDYGLVSSLAPEWPGCFYRRWSVRGEYRAVVYRIERDGSKRLLAGQRISPAGDDYAFFDVDGDGASELLFKDAAGMGMVPRVNIWKLSDTEATCCWSENLMRTLVPEFRPEDNWWLFAWDVQIDAASNCLHYSWTRNLRHGEDVEPEFETERATIPFERLRDILLPFEPVKPEAFDWLCKPEDLGLEKPVPAQLAPRRGTGNASPNRCPCHCAAAARREASWGQASRIGSTTDCIFNKTEIGRGGAWQESHTAKTKMTHGAIERGWGLANASKTARAVRGRYNALRGGGEPPASLFPSNPSGEAASVRSLPAWRAFETPVPVQLVPHHGMSKASYDRRPCRRIAAARRGAANGGQASRVLRRPGLTRRRAVG